MDCKIAAEIRLTGKRARDALDFARTFASVADAVASTLGRSSGCAASVLKPSRDHADFRCGHPQALHSWTAHSVGSCLKSSHPTRFWIARSQTQPLRVYPFVSPCLGNRLRLQLVPFSPATPTPAASTLPSEGPPLSSRLARTRRASTTSRIKNPPPLLKGPPRTTGLPQRCTCRGAQSEADLQSKKHTWKIEAPCSEAPQGIRKRSAVANAMRTAACTPLRRTEPALPLAPCAPLTCGIRRSPGSPRTHHDSRPRGTANERTQNLEFHCCDSGRSLVPRGGIPGP